MEKQKKKKRKKAAAAKGGGEKQGPMRIHAHMFESVRTTETRQKTHSLQGSHRSRRLAAKANDLFGPRCFFRARTAEPCWQLADRRSEGERSLARKEAGHFWSRPSNPLAISTAVPETRTAAHEEDKGRKVMARPPTVLRKSMFVIDRRRTDRSGCQSVSPLVRARAMERMKFEPHPAQAQGGRGVQRRLFVLPGPLSTRWRTGGWPASTASRRSGLIDRDLEQEPTMDGVIETGAPVVDDAGPGAADEMTADREGRRS
ncbi:hypothetical protein CDD83_7284 [Cordyceps sp. RAO-2017]|nr:hypothetical protein CDD83_7284 [Cordyceps sp. RAO-2017]